MKFLLRIPSVNVTKSAGIYGFDYICWRNLKWKASFFVRLKILMRWKTKAENVRAKYQRADQRIYEPK